MVFSMLFFERFGDFLVKKIFSQKEVQLSHFEFEKISL